MKLDITTPSLFFPTVSLLLLAYTNRFLALGALIRQLHSSYHASHDISYLKQVASLRRRIKLVRDMQFCGVLSLLSCTVCLFFIFLELDRVAIALFFFSTLAMIVSLIFSLMEIRVSVQAIDFHLSDLEEKELKKELVKAEQESSFGS